MMKKNTFIFFVEVGDGEIETITTTTLKQAKKIFKKLHPDDFDKIRTITSDDGYEEIN